MEIGTTAGVRRPRGRLQPDHGVALSIDRAALEHAFAWKSSQRATSLGSSSGLRCARRMRRQGRIAAPAASQPASAAYLRSWS